MKNLEGKISIEKGQRKAKRGKRNTREVVKRENKGKIAVETYRRYFEGVKRGKKGNFRSFLSYKYPKTFRKVSRQITLRN